MLLTGLFALSTNLVGGRKPIHKDRITLDCRIEIKYYIIVYFWVLNVTPRVERKTGFLSLSPGSRYEIAFGPIPQ